MYAAVYSAIYRSEDGGTSWTKVLGGGSAYYTNVEVTSSGVVYATLSSDGTDKGIWRSLMGKTWTNITDTAFRQVSMVELQLD